MKNKFVVDGKDFGYLVDLFQKEMLDRFLEERNLELEGDFSIYELLDAFRFSLPVERNFECVYDKLDRWRNQISNPVYKKWLAQDTTKDGVRELKDLVKNFKGRGRLEAICTYLYYAYEYAGLVISSCIEDKIIIEGFVSYLFCIETPKFRNLLVDGKIRSIKEYVDSIDSCVFTLSDSVATIEGTPENCYKLYSFLMNAGYDVKLDIVVDGSETINGIGRYTLSILGFSSIEKDLEEYAKRFDCEFIAPF